MTLALNEMPSGPVQLLKLSDPIEPSGLASPLPLLIVPVACDEVQVSVVPVFESLRRVVPAVPVTVPPGVTVQVLAARPASAGAAVRQATVAAVAAAAAPSTVAPRRVRIGISVSSVSLVLAGGEYVTRR